VPPQADATPIPTPDAAPLITLQPQDQTVTAPASATFQVTASGTPAPTYQWSVNGNPIANATGATYVTPSTAAAQNGFMYTVAVANGVGAAVVSNKAQLIVQTTPPANAAPQITVQPQDQTVTAPAPATFQVTANGTPAPTYQWSLKGNPIANATGATYVTPPTASAQNGFMYTVAVANGVGAAVFSNPAKLNVLAAPRQPQFATQPASVVVAPGAVVTFSVTVTGIAPFQYQWRRGGVDIAGANAATYTTVPVLPADDGTAFSVVVVDGTGLQNVSNPALLIVGLAPTITAQPVNKAVLAPAAATFTVTATGHPLLYQWQDKNGSNIPGATSAAYTTPNTTAGDDQNTYRVVVSGFGAPLPSAYATLTVSAPATITTQPAGQILAVGGPLSLSVVAAGAPASFSYQWFQNGIPIPTAFNATYSKAAALTDNGTYFVQVSNGLGGLVQSLSVPVTVTQIHMVSGNIALLSVPAAPAVGVTVSINTNPPASTTTDAAGNYTLPAVPAGNWTVTPSAPGLSSVFFPATGTVNVTNANVTAHFQTQLGYTVAGRLTYQGNRRGPVYLNLTDANGGQTLGATTVEGEVNYSIRGVPSGTYILNAAMDISGGTLRTVNDPSGTRAAVTVVGSDLIGQDLSLTDPTPAPLTGQAGPATLTMSPMDSGAVAVFPSMTPAGLEQAAQYILEWNAAVDFSSPVGDSMAVQPRRPRNVVFIGPGHGLVNGQVFYFRVHAAAGGTISNETAAASPVTIGARTGGFTVSGEVNFTGAATGPLYVGLLDSSNRATADQAYMAMVNLPGNDQPFAVSGVPAATGGYTLLGFIDQNGSGRIEAGNLSSAPIINLAVTGNLVGQDLDFFREDSHAYVGTSHVQTDGADDKYRLLFRVRDENKHVISATLTAGPNVMVPMDLASPFAGPLLRSTINLANMPGAVPQPGQQYTVQVNYSDGSTGLQFPQVTGVLNSFVQNAAPTNLNGVNLGTNVAPQFSWAVPVPATAPYDYRFSIQTVGGPVFGQNALPGQGKAATFVNWLPANALTAGIPYLWTVTYRENTTDNQTETVSTYTP